jgi:formylglycine-generating enzyme required for sulfatase activity
MIHIPAGPFLMGSNPRVDGDARDIEQPQHTQHLPGYQFATTPVTHAQYAVFVRAAGYPKPINWQERASPPGREDHPVVYVTWHDAASYCRWLSAEMGVLYRLPSEAEWEKAMRGTDGRIYPWGNRWAPERCISRESGRRETSPVGTCPLGASPYGVLDAVGNVREWTRSLFAPYPYAPADGREVEKVREGRVLRGGSYYDDATQMRCAARMTSVYPRNWSFGFRVMAEDVDG